MNLFERALCIKREQEFTGPILSAARHNPIIAKVIHAYAHGEIITREEALSQMVMLLSKDWNEEKRKAMEFAMMQTGSIIP